ncbi:MAG: response regulator transcription factor [Saprospiraceae bacterium]|nr:response regulator transcription factor [Saprospiraceae bacterium]
MTTVLPLRIGLVDDHKILMDGMEALLSMQGDYSILFKVDRGEKLLSRTDLSEIDLLVMDINMPDMDGIDALRSLSKTAFQGYCIILSSYDDLHLVNEAIQAGARGYITKNSATEYLEEAIRAVENGEIYYSPDVRERILKSFSKSNIDLAEENSESAMLRQLTERELEILKLIAQQYTSEEIGKKLFIAKSTVDTHRKNLINKLKVKNAVGLGLFAKRQGLV